MKAAVLSAPERVELTDIQEPECRSDQVLVRMLGLGLCGSDLAVYRGIRQVPSTPWVMGHEGVGEIAAVGDRVTDRQVGQRVAIEPNYPCLDCAACRKGFTSACPNRVIIGLNAPGLLAEYVAIPAEYCFPVAAHVPLEDLVCTEPLTVAMAAMRRSGIAEGASCLVVGTGSQGLFLCTALLASGITPYVIEPHRGRRELAVSMGAVAADEGAAELDYLFEASGVPAALGPALDRLAPGGTAVLVGISAAPLELTSSTLVYRQLKLVGSLIYDHPGDFATTVAALGRRELAPSGALRGRFPLAATAEAFASARSVPGKSWIAFQD